MRSLSRKQQREIRELFEKRFREFGREASRLAIIKLISDETEIDVIAVHQAVRAFR